MALIDTHREKVTVQITIGGVDYTNYAVFAQCNFTTSASAQPGTCTVVLKDHARAFSFVPGKNSLIILWINSVAVWQGYAMQIEQGYFFDAYRERKWTLHGVDLNILLDKLILYNKQYPTKRPDGNGTYLPDSNGIIAVPTNTNDSDYIKVMLAQCTDFNLVTPTIDITTKISTVNVINPDVPFTPPDAGTTVRGFMEDVSRNVLRSQPGSTIWYIGVDAKVNYMAQDTATAPWSIGDDSTGVNVRSLSIMTDISNIKNDVLIFTGNLNPSPTSTQEHLLYRKNSLTASVTQFGRFQYSEVMTQDWMQGMINARSTKILYQEGTPGMRVTFSTWRSGLFPGQILTVSSNVHTFKIWDTGQSQLINVSSFTVPIRAISMSFPTPNVCRYDVTCSFDTQDPWGLLLALKRPPTRGLTQPKFTVIDRVKFPTYHPEAETYDMVREYPQQASGASMKCSYAYIRGSLVVYYNGLRLTPLTDPTTQNRGFIESDPNAGLFQLGFTPVGGKLPYIEYHVWHNLG